MRAFKILLVLFVTLFVAVPTGIVFLLAIIATIGSNANSQLDANSQFGGEVEVTSVSHSEAILDPADPIKIQQGNVTLYFDPATDEAQAEAVLGVLASKCLLGTSDYQYAFSLSSTPAAHQLRCLDSMSLEFCEKLQPIYQSMATIISHQCFQGETFRLVMQPSDADATVIAENRSDVAACWFNGSQSVFFEQPFSPQEIEAILDGFRELEMVSPESDLAHLFFRHTEQSGEVQVIGKQSRLDAIDPATLHATLRYRALQSSLLLCGGRQCTFSVTDPGFNPITSVVHTPPFQPTQFAKNGCMLYLSDDSISQATLDAIAARLPTIPEREITVDFWISQSDNQYTVLAPSPDAVLERGAALQRSRLSTGIGINSELPDEATLTMIACDYDFQPHHAMPVRKRLGPYLARHNNRLSYATSFDEAFANRVADYFESQGVFTEHGSAHVEIFHSDQPESLPCVQLYVTESMIASESTPQVKAFGLKVAAELFPGQRSVFQLCDALGVPLKGYAWLSEG
ncbi:hypothetical protein [Novipirellula caenicola]|uniref:Uncharacterized protein n=1 Tax=Novipirellula caenicola TaxID=1536901 RepID=A0ABP9VTK5_9BACT